MSFAWNDFLTLADGLLRNLPSPGSEESRFRTAISRAYYAAFCSARATAASQDGLMISYAGEDHNRVTAHFRFARDPLRRKIGWDLKRLRDFRNQADYDDVMIGTPRSLAQSSVALAQNILTALAVLNTGSLDE